MVPGDAIGAKGAGSHPRPCAVGPSHSLTCALRLGGRPCALCRPCTTLAGGSPTPDHCIERGGANAQNGATACRPLAASAPDLPSPRCDQSPQGSQAASGSAAASDEWAAPAWGSACDARGLARWRTRASMTSCSRWAAPWGRPPLPLELPPRNCCRGALARPQTPSDPPSGAAPTDRRLGSGQVLPAAAVRGEPPPPAHAERGLACAPT